jgi:hypothetical protein
MFFFFFVPPTKKKNQKEKSSSLKTLRALRFTLPAGLSELGLWPSPQTCRQAFNRRQLRCSLIVLTRQPGLAPVILHVF